MDGIQRITLIYKRARRAFLLITSLFTGTFGVPFHRTVPSNGSTTILIPILHIHGITNAYPIHNITQGNRHDNCLRLSAWIVKW